MNNENSKALMTVNQDAKTTEVQTFYDIETFYAMSMIVGDFVFESKFSYVPIHTNRNVLIAIALLGLLGMAGVGYLMFVFEAYKGMIAVFFAILTAVIVSSISLSRFVIKKLKWVHQGYVVIRRHHLTLTLDNETYDIDLAQVKKYQWYTDINRNSNEKNANIIINMINGDTYHIVSSTKYGIKPKALEDIGLMIYNALPSHFEKADRFSAASIHRGEIVIYSVAAVMSLGILGITYYYELFIGAMLPLLLMSTVGAYFLARSNSTSLHLANKANKVYVNSDCT